MYYHYHYNSHTRHWKLGIGNSELSRNWELGNGDLESGTQNWELRIENPKLELGIGN